MQRQELCCTVMHVYYSFKVYSQVSDSGRFTACLVTLYLCDGDGEEGVGVEINTVGALLYAILCC